MNNPILVGIESLAGFDTTQVRNSLSHHLGAYCVTNYLSTYEKMIQRPIEENELVRVARGQLNEINEYIQMGGKILVVDCGLLSLSVFAQQRFHSVNSELLLMESENRCDIHFVVSNQMEEEETKRQFGKYVDLTKSFARIKEGISNPELCGLFDQLNPQLQPLSK